MKLNTMMPCRLAAILLLIVCLQHSQAGSLNAGYVDDGGDMKGKIDKKFVKFMRHKYQILYIFKI